MFISLRSFRPRNLCESAVRVEGPLTTAVVSAMAAPEAEGLACFIKKPPINLCHRRDRTRSFRDFSFELTPLRAHSKSRHIFCTLRTPRPGALEMFASNNIAYRMLRYRYTAPPATLCHPLRYVTRYCTPSAA
ncbi:hypothetical protein EVAR_81403_1 [Eumeta japonica]|uniref:Uncharacterized protein n=1 Tax=Eumeta variegata TaxID=151549 RepID=A0A4C1WFB9_EUMVA|nr:hypothetical protein EVAR_81403_1 [Eumeta japonica]